MTDNRGKTAEKAIACVSCRHRKIKCTREADGCANCARIEIPCVYQVLDASIKRKRGPYKKNGLIRERELAHITKVMGSQTSKPEKTPSADDLAIASLPTTWTEVALNAPRALQTASVSPSSPFDNGDNIHPSFDIILELWHIYMINVDPLVKVIHCPSFSEALFKVKATLRQVNSSMETLMLSFYYAAINSVSSTEIQTRVAADKEIMLSHYRGLLERRLAVASATSTANILVLQALTLFLFSLYRKDDIKVNWSTYALAVRIAEELLTSSKLTIFETEMLRRAWWTLCRLESRQIEDSNSQPIGFVDWRKVPLPLNLNDSDLDPGIEFLPQSRVGVTDMVFCMTGYKLKNLLSSVTSIRHRNAESTEESNVDVASERLKQIIEYESMMESEILQYCHVSRPLDWSCILICELIQLKTKLITKLPPNNTPDGIYFKTDEKFNSALTVIRNTYLLQTDPRLARWSWYFRGFIQWYALIAVLTECCRFPKSANVSKAWPILDPIIRRCESKRIKPNQSEFFEPVVRLIDQAQKNRVEVTNPDSQQDMTVSSEASSNEFLSSTFSTQPTNSQNLHKPVGEPQPTVQGYASPPTAAQTLPSSLDPDLSSGLDDGWEDFDWKTWIDVAENMDFDFEFL